MNQTLQKEKTVGPNWWNVILGVWIVVSPFVLGFSNRTALMWNDVATGAAIIAVALTRSHSTGRSASILSAVLGVWLIISAFVLGASPVVAVRNNILLGLIVAVVALTAAYNREVRVAPSSSNR